MTSAVQRELQELRVAAESYGVRHVHLEHFAYPRGVCMAVNLTVDFDAMLLRRVHNEPPMQLAKGEFGGRVIAHESHNSATPPTIAIILQLTKLFLLWYNNGYHPYDLDLDESRYENLYINSMFLTIRERLQEIMLHFFELYQRERSNYVSDEIESTLRFMTESIFFHSRPHRSFIAGKISETSRLTMALFDQILSDDAPPSDYRGQMLEISSSFASDVAPLFDNPYINTYKTAVSALASAIVLGSIGLIIYKLG